MERTPWTAFVVDALPVTDAVKQRSHAKSVAAIGVSLLLAALASLCLSLVVLL